MHEQKDAPLSCADCGATFVFTGAEAEVFAARGLTPPKRCKECRQARKAADQQRARGSRGPQQAAPQARSRGGNERAPRYTGDVNEYRSPMQDRYGATGFAAPAPRSSGGPARSGPRFDGPARQPQRSAKPVVRAASTGTETEGAAAPKAPRKRREAPKFAITCSTCGAQSHVPFEPTEGREIFCGDCYRARRAPAAAPVEPS